MDALTLAIVMPMVPMAFILILWLVSRRGGKSGKGRELSFLLGFLSITLFFVFMPNPYNIYADGGEGMSMEAIFAFSSVAMLFLAIAVFVFKSYRKG